MLPETTLMTAKAAVVTNKPILVIQDHYIEVCFHIIGAVNSKSTIITKVKCDGHKCKGSTLKSREIQILFSKIYGTPQLCSILLLFIIFLIIKNYKM